MRGGKHTWDGGSGVCPCSSLRYVLQQRQHVCMPSSVPAVSHRTRCLCHATAPHRWVQVREELLLTPHGRERLLAGRPKIQGVPWIDEYVAALQQASLELPGDSKIGQLESSIVTLLQLAQPLTLPLFCMLFPCSMAALPGSPSRRRSVCTARTASTTTAQKPRQQPAFERWRWRPLPQTWLLLRRCTSPAMQRRLCQSAPLPTQLRLLPRLPSVPRRRRRMASSQPVPRTVAPPSRQRRQLSMTMQDFTMLGSAQAGRALGKPSTSRPPPLWQLQPATRRPRLCRANGRLQLASHCLQLGLAPSMQSAAGLALLPPPRPPQQAMSLRSHRWEQAECRVQPCHP